MGGGDAGLSETAVSGESGDPAGTAVLDLDGFFVRGTLGVGTALGFADVELVVVDIVVSGA